MATTLLALVTSILESAGLAGKFSVYPQYSAESVVIEPLGGDSFVTALNYSNAIAVALEDAGGLVFVPCHTTTGHRIKFARS